MLKIITCSLFIFLVCCPIISAQNLLNNPESVVYDSSRYRYIVSNYGDGALVQIDSNRIQSYFSTALQGQFHTVGIYIYEDMLLAAAVSTTNKGIAGFSLESGDFLFYIPISGVGMPNDITSDANGNIYVTDYYGSRLYKIVDWVPSIYVGQGLVNPNGIMYDQQNNRLLVVSVLSAGTPVMAVNLEDSSVTMVVNSPVLGGDGITMDSDRNLYLSGWTADAVFRYSIEMLNPPTIFYSGLCDPADIYYDRVNDLICIPNFSSNSVAFLPVNPSGVSDKEYSNQPNKINLSPNYPNPFNAITTIPYQLATNTRVRLEIIDILGQSVNTLVDQVQTAGFHQVSWNSADLASGIYFYRLQAGDYSSVRKMVIMK